MRVLNWIFGIPNAPISQSDGAPSSSLPSRLHTKPASIETKATKKNNSAQRVIQRDRVSSVIREVLAGADIQNSTAKYKVMTVDSLSVEFIALVELGREVPKRSERAAELGASIILNARQKFGVNVTGIYWKLDEFEVPTANASVLTPTVASPKEFFLTANNPQHDKEMALLADARKLANKLPASHIPDPAEMAAFKTALIEQKL